MKIDMKQLWKDWAPLVLTVTMVVAMFSDMMFGHEVGQVVSSLVVGVACLLFLTFTAKPWFGVKYIRKGVFLVVGLANIFMGISHLIQL